MDSRRRRLGRGLELGLYCNEGAAAGIEGAAGGVGASKQAGTSSLQFSDGLADTLVERLAVPWWERVTAGMLLS